jgi:hypothetical protein
MRGRLLLRHSGLALEVGGLTQLPDFGHAPVPDGY